ncbi:MAG TPA: CxxxxCH/CxxCH domain-containing protein [Anaeromyxobacteraceae bacterium]|jgi:predicted CxxxxCH...CXXCH cytochrome family protein|nr:CxxxxCH/CxxCH domain-containing protein [Anaeromyxobacteraceae bacterium]
MSRPLRTLLLAAGLLAVAGCGSSREATEAGGQTTCSTCHGYPPATGAHLAHVTPAASGSPAALVLQKAFDCNQCHFKPHAVGDPGHIVQANGAAVPKPAQVRFDQPGALAGLTAKFDPATRVCSNVYCHGGNGVPSEGSYTWPKWEDPPSAAACGTCHGIPPANHASTIRQIDCVKCHAPSATATGGVDPVTHIDGKFEINTPTP